MPNKADYYTAAQSYTDDDGLSRSFTNIDYSYKSKMSIAPTQEEISEAKNSLKEYRESLLEQIFQIPASLHPLPYTDFVIRGENHTQISWNKEMLSDGGMTIERLQPLLTLLKNRKEQVTRTY